MSKKNLAAVITMFSALVISGCYMKQGKLYFDELNLDPITIYNMASLETTIYCLTEGDLPTGKRLERMHREAKKEVEQYPENNNWGRLVCLSLAEGATEKQILETINTLQLVIAVRHHQAEPARGFKKLLEQKLSFLQAIEKEQQNLDEEKTRYAAEEAVLKKEVTRQKELQAAEKEKVKRLESKVQRLQEIEMLLHPKE